MPRSTIATPILTTCELCRRRKVKCDGRRPKCANCVRHDSDCIYRESYRHGPRRKHCQQTRNSTATATATAAAASIAAPSTPAASLFSDRGSGTAVSAKALVNGAADAASIAGDDGVSARARITGATDSSNGNRPSDYDRVGGNGSGGRSRGSPSLGPRTTNNADTTEHRRLPPYTSSVANSIIGANNPPPPSTASADPTRPSAPLSNPFSLNCRRPYSQSAGDHSGGKDSDGGNPDRHMTKPCAPDWYPPQFYYHKYHSLPPPSPGPNPNTSKSTTTDDSENALPQSGLCHRRRHGQGDHPEDSTPPVLTAPALSGGRPANPFTAHTNSAYHHCDDVSRPKCHNSEPPPPASSSGLSYLADASAAHQSTTRSSQPEARHGLGYSQQQQQQQQHHRPDERSPYSSSGGRLAPWEPWGTQCSGVSRTPLSWPYSIAVVSPTPISASEDGYSLPYAPNHTDSEADSGSRDHHLHSHAPNHRYQQNTQHYRGHQGQDHRHHPYYYYYRHHHRYQQQQQPTYPNETTTIHSSPIITSGTAVSVHTNELSSTERTIGISSRGHEATEHPTPEPAPYIPPPLSGSSSNPCMLSQHDREKLLRFFFAQVQAPRLFIIHQNMFWAKYRIGKVSGFLVNAILLVASSFSGAIILPAELSEVLSRRYHNICMQLAEENAMVNPSLENIQALLLVSIYECGVGRTPFMWRHSTTALRMIKRLRFRGASYPWKGMRRTIARGPRTAATAIHTESSVASAAATAVTPDTDSPELAPDQMLDFEYEYLIRTFWHVFFMDTFAAFNLLDHTNVLVPSTVPDCPTYDHCFRRTRITANLDSQSPAGYVLEYHPPSSVDAELSEEEPLGYIAVMASQFQLAKAINNVVIRFTTDGVVPPFEDFLKFEKRLDELDKNPPKPVDLDLSKFQVDNLNNKEASTIYEVVIYEMLLIHARVCLHKMAIAICLGRDPRKCNLCKFPIGFCESKEEKARKKADEGAAETSTTVSGAPTKGPVNEDEDEAKSEAGEMDDAMNIDENENHDGNVGGGNGAAATKKHQHHRRQVGKPPRQGSEPPPRAGAASPPTPLHRGYDETQLRRSRKICWELAERVVSLLKLSREAELEQHGMLMWNMQCVAYTAIILVDHIHSGTTEEAWDAMIKLLEILRGIRWVAWRKPVHVLLYIVVYSLLDPKLRLKAPGTASSGLMEELGDGLVRPTTISPTTLDSNNPFPPNHVLSIAMGSLNMTPYDFFTPIFPLLTEKDVLEEEGGAWAFLVDMARKYWDGLREQDDEVQKSVWYTSEIFNYFPVCWSQGRHPDSDRNTVII